MNEFSTIQTIYGKALLRVNNERYDGFYGFHEIVKYLDSVEHGSICVMRDFRGAMVPLKINPQRNYAEWDGCFSYMNKGV